GAHGGPGARNVDVDVVAIDPAHLGGTQVVLDLGSRHPLADPYDVARHLASPAYAGYLGAIQPSASSRSTAVRLGAARLAPVQRTSLSWMPWRLARKRSASVQSAPVRSACDRSECCSFAPTNSAPCAFVSVSIASRTSAPDRLADPISALVKV